VVRVFAPDGPIARTLPGYEPRPGQIAMAAAVARTLDAGGTLLAEAGTGTGKTLAYLVPAILSRQRVLVSTGTKNLQEQIFFKDLPALRASLDVPFTASYMKGRANYLCLQRLDELTGEARVATPAAGQRERSTARPARVPDAVTDTVFLPIIRRWAAETETGDRTELGDLPEDLAIWHDLAATADTCLGTECPRYDECFVTRMRQRAAEADVVVVNHHLLCADAAVRQHAYGEVIPACAHAIVDEAHQLEDVATQYFGRSVSTFRVEDLVRDVERVALIRALDPARRTALASAIDRVRDDASVCFAEIAGAHRVGARAPGRTEERVRATRGTLTPAWEAGASLAAALGDVESALAVLAARGDGADPPDADADRSGSWPPDHEDAPDRSETLAALARRCDELGTDIRFLLRADDPDHVFYVEFRGKGVFLRASPIDVAAIVREFLLDRMRATILTSATLAVDDTFEYIRARLGIGSAEELRLPSEYDYARQAILYLPKSMPDPKSSDFVLAAGREVVEILRRTRGRAFVLFTSYASLRAVQALAELALPYPILAQGTAPRTALLRQFRTTPHAVLFATASFWQGVDVVGEALSCVIIDKLPFASPSDPITSARIDAIRARGGEPFSEYQVPLAILTLLQGLGRLIRHRQDRGVLAVLDPRLSTKGYGRRFMASLPAAPVVRGLEGVEAFFPIV
jgi:ATP-dependent DNA helicase DinG